MSTVRGDGSKEGATPGCGGSVGDGLPEFLGTVADPGTRRHRLVETGAHRLACSWGVGGR